METRNPSDELLQRIATDFDTPETLGLVICGSVARGEAHRYSDIDLIRFVAPGTPGVGQHGSQRIYDGYFTSVFVTTFERSGDLSQPENAIWLATRNSTFRVLIDRSDGVLQAMIKAAQNFEWTALQPAADAYAVNELLRHAEEANKLLWALVSGDDEVITHPLSWLTDGLSMLMVVKHGILLRADKYIYPLVREAVGKDSAWSAYQMQAAGYQPLTLRERAIAAIKLYAETARLLERLTSAEQRQVIAPTLDWIAEAGY